MTKTVVKSALAMLISFMGFGAQAQRVTDPVLKNMVKSTIAKSATQPVEKLYIQTDKPVYPAGDTLRLKAYLLNGDYRSPSVISGILYVELGDEAGKNVKRMMLPVTNGLAWADMTLDTADVKQGNYTLRAYTNWMRNFGEDYIFKKHITISGHNGNPLLVNSLFKQEGNTVEAGLQLMQLNGGLYGFKDVEIKLMSGKQNISTDKQITGPDGMLKFNFTLPQSNNPISIKLLTAGKEELIVPVALNRMENTDVQFLPEGGQLVGGLPVKVGIKAINEEGKGTNISGKLYNSKSEEIAEINTIYKGMGSFAFTPQAGETYTAKINGINKSYYLPAVKSSGTVLRITKTHPDSLTIKIQTTSKSNTTIYLIGQARGVICYAEPISLNKAGTKTISTNLFPSGIARFTLLDAQQQPLNERIVFINHNDALNISIQPDKSIYNTRDSIALAINVTDKTGKPVQGSFSMAVTDNSQVKTDSLGSNILNHLLLTSDLKGDIEDPNYYFIGNKETELDNLMLTQGWVGYDWKEILSNPNQPIVYQPEREFMVSGTVTNAFGKPIGKSKVALMGKSPLVVADTLTDKNGKFIFRDIWPVYTAIFKLQARNKNNKEFNVNIKMDEQSFPEFKADTSNKVPWYINVDTTLLNNATTLIAEEKARNEFKGGGNVLKEVNIKAKKVVKGSKNLNGPGEADLVLDEEDMLKAGKRTLNDLLKEKIPGIQEFGKGKRPIPYTLFGKRVSFVIDGMDIDKFFHPDYASIEENPMLNSAAKADMKHDLFVQERSTMINTYLTYYTAEDVVGIELMFNPKYNRAYAGNLVPGGGSEGPDDRLGTAKFDSRAYIEITTRSNQGPFMKVTPGTYLYKPLAFTFAKQFYSPKYAATNRTTAPGIDLRSTIFWEPNIVTDTNGKATFSFYSADKLSNYTVITEGSDMNGQFGSSKAEVKLTTQ